MDRGDGGVRLGRQEAVDEVRPGNWFRLGAPVAIEFGPDAREGEQRPVLVQREPDHILLRFGIRLGRVPGETVCGDQAAVLRPQPSAPTGAGQSGNTPGIGGRLPT